MNAFKERRFGRIKVTKQCIDDMPEELYQMFCSKLFVFKAEHDIVSGVMMFTCACSLFEPVEEGCEIPSYRVDINRCDYPKARNYDIVVS